MAMILAFASWTILCIHGSHATAASSSFFAIAATCSAGEPPCYAQLTRVYQLARLHVNFFQPVEKLVTKSREGACVHRVYDRAQTPYQRLCAAGTGLKGISR